MELRMKQPPLDAQIVCIYTPVATLPLALYPELAGIDCRASGGDCGPQEVIAGHKRKNRMFGRRWPISALTKPNMKAKAASGRYRG
jgi:hypothetical protein